ncbi:unnamed protein product [Psylliodes chrysocephalus]|uniref:Uncharacterized protein n=1 Tax=Psylliodes chrysocephalus TaxID=3402493 RepID=A0A9P0GEL2_9CUCU|nr:unnamed protein product [Psylliodes chrysocephala]
MNNAKKLRKETPSLKNNLCSGRIVELLELGKHLKCCWCERVLSLENITNETRKGLYSILNVKYNECNIETIVPTDKVHATKSEVKHSDVNTKAVLENERKSLENTRLESMENAAGRPESYENAADPRPEQPLSDTYTETSDQNNNSQSPQYSVDGSRSDANDSMEKLRKTLERSNSPD